MARSNTKRKSSSSSKPRITRAPKPVQRQTRTNKSSKKSKKSQKKNTNSGNQGLWLEGVGIFLLCAAAFIAISLFSLVKDGGAAYSETWELRNALGPLGLVVSKFLFRLFGWCSFLVPVGLSFAAVRLVVRRPEGVAATSLVAWAFAISTLAGISSTFESLRVWDLSGGGLLGNYLANFLVSIANRFGAILFLGSAFLVSIIFATGIRTAPLIEKLAALPALCFEVVSDIVFALSKTGLVVFGALVTLFSRFRDGLVSLFSLSAQTFESRSAIRAEKSQARKAELERIKSSGQTEGSTAIEGKKYTLGLKSGSVEPAKGKVVDSKSLTSQPEEESIESVAAAEAAEIKISRYDFSAEKKTGESPVFQTKRPSPSYEDYKLPPSDLLSASAEIDSSEDDSLLVENSRLLEQALTDFKIGGRVVEVHPGPVITLYEYLPAAGVKVGKIIGLSDDLALSLKVARVRVYAPVPGKGTVGIEVPNSERQIVRLREVLDSENTWDDSKPLEIALGKDTFGQTQVADLARMPHLLIAGATGTGKSVNINSILLSLLCRNTPDDLRLILIDPKMLELTVYEGIPHLKSKVVTNPKHARGVLWWAVEEMERRYKLMMDLGVRNLDSYNRAISEDSEEEDSTVEQTDIVSSEEVGELPGEQGGADRKAEIIEEPSFKSAAVSELERLPRIVIVVDELADLMLTVGREIEELLTRLAQKARAAGIHLILATQRPSVNVITGLIKANFPARISFQVASKIDSRTVLDCSGAEKLLGQGDMLFQPPGTGRLKRLHSPFVSDQEVAKVVDHIREQGASDYDPDIEKVIERLNASEAISEGGYGADEEFDPLYDKAVALVVEKGQASTSMVQRAFRIGYNRAARILDCMESEGIVGPADGSRPRQVLVADRSTGEC